MKTAHLFRLGSLTLCTQTMLLFDGAVGSHLLLNVFLARNRLLHIILAPYSVMRPRHANQRPPMLTVVCMQYYAARTGLLSVDGATLELRLMLLVSITSVYALAFSPSVETLVGDVLAALAALRLAGIAYSRRERDARGNNGQNGGRLLYAHTTV